jgi:hypothetical protein
LKISKVLNGYITVCYLEDSLVVAKRGRIYVYNFFTQSLTFIVALPESMMIYYLFSFKLFFRFFRYGVRCGIALDRNRLFVVFKKKYYLIEIKERTFIDLGVVEKGNRPLNIISIDNSKSFDHGIYYGEYFNNPNKEFVNIWYFDVIKRKKRIVFTFGKGVLNHIHNLVYDEIKDEIWVLAGDFESSASIWLVKENFNNVSLIDSSKQIYRSCVGFKSSETELIYATDSQLERNSIRKITNNGNSHCNEFVCHINGPVIYGARHGDNFIFSTSVEGVSSFKNPFLRYFDRDIGPGVLEDYSHIIIGNYNTGFKTIVKYKKDVWPFVLFQFGAVIFPSGISKSGFIATHHIALKPYDICTVIYNLEEN